jgi:flagellar biosynthesis protein FliR
MNKRGNRSTSVGSVSALAIALALGGVLYTPDAHAYLDAGTGSLILQVAAGVFLGIFLSFKFWWYRFMGAVRRIFGHEKLNAE